MNKKSFVIWFAACSVGMLAPGSDAAAKARPKKVKQLSTSQKMDQLGANQLKLLMIQDRELQTLREIQQQLKTARPTEPGFPYPYTYP